MRYTRRAMPPPNATSRTVAFDLKGDAPTSAEEFAAGLGTVVDYEVVQGAIRGVVAYVLHGRSGLRIAFEGEQAVALDDLVRAYAEQIAADAVAVLQKVPVPAGVPASSCYVLAAECAGTKVDRLIALRGVSARGKADEYQILLRKHTNPKLVWLGVPPSAPVDFTAVEPDPIGEA